MDSIFKIDINSHIPIYKQMIASFEQSLDNGDLYVGQGLPSMNELSANLDISKETVKKVYSILRERGLIESMHGKGFFVTTRRDERKLRVFMLLDKLSQFKQMLYDAFIEEIGDKAEITIYLYNQNIETFEDFIDRVLDKYDYYLITPHFPLKSEVQARVLKALKRIPNRKLILLDNWMRSLQGNYGAVYQDIANDIYKGLEPGLEDLRKYSKLHVIILPSSLYGSLIMECLARFCGDHNLEVEFHYDFSPEIIESGGVYLLLNGQLGLGLVEVARMANEKGLDIGKDVGIISYNDGYLSDIILGGLTTISTDFKQMGRLAAEMVLTHNLRKVRCDFKLKRRKTF